MFGKRVYLVRIAYSDNERNGENVSIVVAKNKAHALAKALSNDFLKGKICSIIDIRKVNNKLASVVAEHNAQIKGESGNE